MMKSNSQLKKLWVQMLVYNQLLVVVSCFIISFEYVNRFKNIDIFNCIECYGTKNLHIFLKMSTY